MMSILIRVLSLKKCIVIRMLEMFKHCTNRQHAKRDNQKHGKVLQNILKLSTLIKQKLSPILAKAVFISRTGMLGIVLHVRHRNSRENLDSTFFNIEPILLILHLTFSYLKVYFRRKRLEML